MEHEPNLSRLYGWPPIRRAFDVVRLGLGTLYIESLRQHQGSGRKVWGQDTESWVFIMGIEDHITYLIKNHMYNMVQHTT